MRSVYEFDRKLFFCQVLPIIPAVAASYLGTLMPAEVVKGLQSKRAVSKVRETSRGSVYDDRVILNFSSGGISGILGEKDQVRCRK